MFRNIRALLSVRRLPLRAESFLAQNEGLYNVRRVQISRPNPFSRFKKNLPYATGAVIGWYVLYPELMGEEEDTGTQEESHGKESDGNTTKSPSQGVNQSRTDDKPDENAFFIPLGLAKQCQMKPYKGSDPEWQEYVKFSHNPERGMKIRRELAALVEQAVRMNKGFSRRLGDQVAVTKYWLDLDYPDTPPPEYERSGLEITEDHIAWTKRKVTATNYHRLQHVLWPTAAANGVLVTFWAVTYSQYIRLKEFFGFKSKDEKNSRTNWNPVVDPAQAEKDRAEFEKLRAEMEKTRAEMRRRRAAFEKERAEKLGKGHADSEKYRAQIEKGSQSSSMQATSSDSKNSPAKQASGPTEEASSALSKPGSGLQATSSDAKDSSAKQESDPTEEASSTLSKPGRSGLQATASNAKDSPAKQESDPTEEASSALSKPRRSGQRPVAPQPESNVSEVSVWEFFKSVLEKSWRPPPVIPPRGCIMVSGLVEVVGTRAVCVIDTKAAYNPKTSRWEVVGVVVRRIAERSQAPKGGP